MLRNYTDNYSSLQQNVSAVKKGEKQISRLFKGDVLVLDSMNANHGI